MSHVPATMRTMPAQRSWPIATSPAAKNVNASPTTVTWFGVNGVRPSAFINASALRRTHASNRVVNTAYLQGRDGLRGARFAGVDVDIDDLRRDGLPRVASRLLERVRGKTRAELGVAREDHERGRELAPVLRRHSDA